MQQIVSRPASRDAWTYSFRLEQAKGLDPMMLTGTRLSDLKGTLRRDKQNDTKSRRVDNLTGDVNHTMTQSFDFTNN